MSDIFLPLMGLSQTSPRIMLVEQSPSHELVQSRASYPTYWHDRLTFDGADRNSMIDRIQRRENGR